VPLEQQDRSAWDHDLITEADELLKRALETAPPGRFTLQGAIAATHAQAPTYAATDWQQILVLYDGLLRIWPSPVVALNRAVASSMVDGPAVALRQVEALAADQRLSRYRYLHAVKADLLRRLGRTHEAVDAYRAALDRTDNEAEQAFLLERIGSL
jgi:RNA polymerase sigma-70 factor (ECF subfamily)